METHTLVEPLYHLKGQEAHTRKSERAEGREFRRATVRGGQMLGDLWFSAWQQAGEDQYLIRQLTDRASANARKP
jgi:hypothetical protein